MWRVSGWRQSWDEWDFRQSGEKPQRRAAGDKGVTQTGWDACQTDRLGNSDAARDEEQARRRRRRQIELLGRDSAIVQGGPTRARRD